MTVRQRLSRSRPRTGLAVLAEMDHRVDPTQCGGDHRAVLDVADYEVGTKGGQSRAGSFAGVPVDVVAQRVQDDHPVRRGHQCGSHRLADEAGSSSHQYLHPATFSRAVTCRRAVAVVGPVRPVLPSGRKCWLLALA
jgi:hypothetical protein